MNQSDQRNISMMMDLYEMTMANGYFQDPGAEDLVTFDVFYRKNPDGAGFAIFAGLEQVLDYLEGMHFDDADIAYLRSLHIYAEDFLDWLRDFRFRGTVRALPEGSIMYPNEPILTVEAPLIDAQLVETAILAQVNHQSLIATKTNRIVRSAEGRLVADFGARRAHNVDAAVYGARAAYIGGAASTATMLAGEMFGIPVSGTMAHSWVMYHDDEYTAFKHFAEIYPDNSVLLVDTYDVLASGVPNAIRVAKEVLMPMGKRLKGIRLDSGDLAYLSKKARKMLDAAGLEDCIIVASNSLDEFTIHSLLEQGACIDSFGVGERLITAKSDPVFGAVYKLVAVENKDGVIEPKIKISENTGKITNPHFKKLYRFYGNDTGKAIADYLCVWDETVDDSQNLRIFDPEATWKEKEVYNFTAKELQVPVFRNGKLVYKLPTLEEIRTYCRQQVDTLWDEVKRFDNPHTYYVDLSQRLWDIKYDLLKTNAGGERYEKKV